MPVENNQPLDNPFSFLLIFGSRNLANHPCDWDDNTGIRNYVRARLADLHLNPERVAILSGGASGPDIWGIEWATKNGFFTLEDKPDYSRYGRGAPIMRDKAMAEKCDMAIGFWDGESKGTAHTKKFILDLQKPLIFYQLRIGIRGDPYFTWSIRNDRFSRLSV